MLTREQLLNQVTYKDGKLYRKNGTRFGTLALTGYRQGSILGKFYYEHRLIWFYHYGVWPDELDHIDGNRDHNKLENLREVTSQQNKFNTVSRPGSSSQYKGVDKFRNRWRARYRLNGKEVHLGVFDTEIEAANAYDNAVREHQGEFMKENYA